MTDYFYSWLDSYKPNNDDLECWEEKDAFLILPAQVTQGEWYGSISFMNKDDALRALDEHVKKLQELRRQLE